MSDIRPPKHLYTTVEKIKQAAQTMLIDNIELETPKLVDNSDMYDILYSIANLSNVVNVKSPEIGDDGTWITYNQDGSHSDTNVSAKGTSIVFDKEEVAETSDLDKAKIFVVDPIEDQEDGSVDNNIKLGQYIYTPETEWFTEIHIKDGWQDDEDYQDIQEITSSESLGIVNIRTTGGLQIDKTKNDDGEDVLLIGSPTRYFRHITDETLSDSIATYYPDNTLISAQYDYTEVEGNKYTITPTFISKYNTLSLNINLLFSIYRGSYRSSGDPGDQQYGSVLANDTISLLIVDGVYKNSRVNNTLSVFTDRESSGPDGTPVIDILSCTVVEDSINHCFRITPTIMISGWATKDKSYPYFEVNLIGHINNYGISLID